MTRSPETAHLRTGDGPPPDAIGSGQPGLRPHRAVRAAIFQFHLVASIREPPTYGGGRRAEPQQRCDYPRGNRRQRVISIGAAFIAEDNGKIERRLGQHAQDQVVTCQSVAPCQWHQADDPGPRLLRHPRTRQCYTDQLPRQHRLRRHGSRPAHRKQRRPSQPGQVGCDPTQPRGLPYRGPGHIPGGASARNPHHHGVWPGPMPRGSTRPATIPRRPNAS